MKKKLIIFLAVMLVIDIAAAVYFVGKDIRETKWIRNTDEYSGGWFCGTPYIMENSKYDYHKGPEDFSCDQYEYILLEDGTAEIRNYHGRETEVQIPVMLDGHKVSAIGKNAFYHPNVTEYKSEDTKNNNPEEKKDDAVPKPVLAVSLPKGKNGYNGPVSIVIPDGVTTIRAEAFSLCKDLSSITIPDSVTIVEESAFRGCSGMVSILVSPEHPALSVNGGALIIRADKRIAFYPSGADVHSYEIPKGIERIDDYAFEGARLKEIIIPDSVTSIGIKAFSECEELRSVQIPGGVTEIGEYLFQNCKNLKKVIISEGVRSIGEFAFCDCESLESITVPDSVVSIGACAFIRCKKLRSFRIPEGISTIEDGTFSDCHSLNSLTIPGSVKRIENEAFRTCKNLVSVRIAEGVEYIGDIAFDECENLSEISLPESIATLGKNPFRNCRKLKSIRVSGNHPALEMTDGVLFSKTDRQLICYPCARKADSYEIPAGTVTIGEWAFDDVESLTCVTIPDSVTTIRSQAFCSCQQLRSITVPANVSIIERFGFSLCPTLTVAVQRGSVAEQFCTEENVSYTYTEAES